MSSVCGKNIYFSESKSLFQPLPFSVFMSIITIQHSIMLTTFISYKRTAINNLEVHVRNSQTFQYSTNINFCKNVRSLLKQLRVFFQGFVQSKGRLENQMMSQKVLTLNNTFCHVKKLPAQKLPFNTVLLRNFSTSNSAKSILMRLLSVSYWMMTIYPFNMKSKFGLKM